MPQQIDHCHLYLVVPTEVETAAGIGPRLETLYCFFEDCYQGGLNRETYPVEKIGPKLMVRRETKSYNREEA